MADWDEKQKQTWAAEEHIEDADLKAGIPSDVTALSAIEATAASTAAWLITLIVSLGGFLFGMITRQEHWSIDLHIDQDTTLAISVQYSSASVLRSVTNFPPANKSLSHLSPAVALWLEPSLLVLEQIAMDENGQYGLLVWSSLLEQSFKPHRSMCLSLRSDDSLSGSVLDQRL